MSMTTLGGEGGLVGAYIQPRTGNPLYLPELSQMFYSIATSLVGDNALLVQDGNDDLSARAVTKRQQEYKCGESDAEQGGRGSQRHYEIK